MSFIINNTLIGTQPIADNETVQRHPLGTIVTATSPTYGVGEFIYLKGVGSTVRGSAVTYNADDFSTALLAANAIGPVAIAMSACVADQFGWYQISGKAVVASDAASDNANCYIDGTSGRFDDAVVDGDMVHLAKYASADGTPSAGLAEVEIHRPYTDDITTND